MSASIAPGSHCAEVRELSDPDSVEELDRLAHAIALGEGFQFILVLVRSPRAVRRLLDTLPEAVRWAGGPELEVDLIDPYSPSIYEPDLPAFTDALLQAVNSRLRPASTEAESTRRVVALDVTGSSDADLKGWLTLFGRMNEQRNGIMARFPGCLLFLLNEIQYVQVAHSAPDLWSVRSTTVKLLHIPPMAVRDRGGSPTPVIEPSRAPSTGWDPAALGDRISAARAQWAEQPEDASAGQRLFWLLEELSDECFVRSDIGSAFDAAMESHRIAQRLTRLHPERVDFLRDLAASSKRLGDLYRARTLSHSTQPALEGESVGSRPPDPSQLARHSYESALHISQRLVDQEPDRADYQHDHADSCERLGNLYRELSCETLARQSLETAVHIRQWLVTKQPNRADFQHRLALSHLMTGDLYEDLGLRELARRSYRRALEIVQCVSDREPDRPEYLRSLMVSHLRIADVDPKEATSHLMLALNTATSLLRAGTLNPADVWIPAVVQDRLAAHPSADDASPHADNSRLPG